MLNFNGGRDLEKNTTGGYDAVVSRNVILGGRVAGGHNSYLDRCKEGQNNPECETLGISYRALRNLPIRPSQGGSPGDR